MKSSDGVLLKFWKNRRFLFVLPGPSPTYSLRKGLSLGGHKVLNNLLFCGEILRGTVGIVGQIDVEFVIDFLNTVL